MNWNEKRARRVLQAALDNAARGRGMSDRTLERTAALTRPEASQSPAAMRKALRQAGWSRSRINRAIAEVQRPGIARRVVRAVRRHPKVSIAASVVTAGCAASVAIHSVGPLMLAAVAYVALLDMVDR